MLLLLVPFLFMGISPVIGRSLKRFRGGAAVAGDLLSNPSVQNLLSGGGMRSLSWPQFTEVVRTVNSQVEEVGQSIKKAEQMIGYYQDVGVGVICTFSVLIFLILLCNLKNWGSIQRLFSKVKNPLPLNLDQVRKNMAEFLRIRGMELPEEVTHPPRMQHSGVLPYNPPFVYQNQPAVGMRQPVPPGQVQNPDLPPNYENGNYLLALNGAMLDQVQPSLIEEDMQDILAKVAVYANLVGTLVDIPPSVDASQEVKDFINAQKPEYTDLKKQVKEAKSKVQRILSGEAKMKAALAQLNKSSQPAPSSSFLKLPRLQFPQFQDNQTGTINRANFHSILLRLTTGMNAEEKIFLLKSALSGKSKKLVVNEQNFDAAVKMLQSCYGNELIETQSKIQEFVGMVTEEASEKASSDLNRDLWQKFKTPKYRILD